MLRKSAESVLEEHLEILQNQELTQEARHSLAIIFFEFVSIVDDLSTRVDSTWSLPGKLRPEEIRHINLIRSKLLDAAQELDE